MFVQSPRRSRLTFDLLLLLSFSSPSFAHIHIHIAANCQLE